MKRLKGWLLARLRSTERLTGTDNVYLAKNVGYVNALQIVSVATGAVLFFVAARVLPKEVYGEYKYYLSLFGLFAVTTFTGIDAALSRAVANGFDGSLMTAFRRKLLGGLAGALLAGAAALYYAWRGREDLALALLLLAVIAPFIYAATVYGSFFVGQKRFDAYFKSAAGVQLLSFFGMLAAFLTIRSPEILFLVFLATAAVNLFAFVWAMRSRRNTGTDPDLVPYGMHLSALDVLATIAMSIDGVLIFQFLGAAPLAVYAIATAPVEQMKGFLKSVSSVAAPKMTTADYPALRAALPRKLALYALVVGAAVAAYVFLAPWLYRFLLPNYMDAVFFSQVYAVSLLAAMPANVLQTLFQARGWRRENTIFNVVSYGAQIVFLVVGAYVYGLWGAIVARMLGRGVMLVAGYALFLSAKDAPHKTV